MAARSIRRFKAPISENVLVSRPRQRIAASRGCQLTETHYERSIVWLRRDLRLADNRALYEAARSSEATCLAFVIDPQLLRDDRMGAPIVQCFFSALEALRSDLRERGSDLMVLQGDPAQEILTLVRRVRAGAVFYNEDYEPVAISRDARAAKLLRSAGIDVYPTTDHVYFAADEVLQPSGRPYSVFTPYKRRWLEQRAIAPRRPFPSLPAAEKRLLKIADLGASQDVPTAEAWGYASSREYPLASEALAGGLLNEFMQGGDGIERYREQRDVPSLAGTSKLSPQLRAGTIGIRTCVEEAFAVVRERAAISASIDTWVSELIWRDFYQMVLKVWPHVASGPFLEKARRIAWRRSGSDFDAWCSGATGYPIVDAGMRQLNARGWMHNRLRMIAASFLTKDLLIDWREGERYFERHLADADMAANNGGWQWSASTGTDAAPYFRIFNPVVQGKRFDPDGTFVRGMIPELRRVPSEYVHAPWEMPPLVAREAGFRIGFNYPEPIVDHAAARDRALRAFAVLRA
jgi:deoxyribodipyrimidine photo-lyase